mmetsp:Transcript_15834/g.43193  ORF Transcript_15834/g.43193 Transcript_15834/m.43193 type:complete len:81 (-) Transcript_15834:73-315(-)
MALAVASRSAAVSFKLSPKTRSRWTAARVFGVKGEGEETVFAVGILVDRVYCVGTPRTFGEQGIDFTSPVDARVDLPAGD